jgi:hypothetical protein
MTRPALIFGTLLSYTAPPLLASCGVGTRYADAQKGQMQIQKGALPWLEGGDYLAYTWLVTGS